MYRGEEGHRQMNHEPPRQPSSECLPNQTLSFSCTQKQPRRLGRPNRRNRRLLFSFVPVLQIRKRLYLFKSTSRIQWESISVFAACSHVRVRGDQYCAKCFVWKKAHNSRAILQLRVTAACGVPSPNEGRCHDMHFAHTHAREQLICASKESKVY